MKTLDRSVETMFRSLLWFIEMNAKISRIAFTTERFDGLCIHAEFDWALHSFYTARIASETMTDILPGCRERTNWDNSDSNVSVFFIVFHRNLIQMILLIKVWFVIQYAFVHYSSTTISINLLVGCCNQVFSLVELLFVYWSQITSTTITTKFVAMAETAVLQKCQMISR